MFSVREVLDSLYFPFICPLSCHALEKGVVDILNYIKLQYK